MRGGSQIDLSFKNTTDYPVYITAQVMTDPSNKKRLVAKVSIYGEDLGNVRYDLVTELVETLPSIMDPVQGHLQAKARKDLRSVQSKGLISRKKERR